MFYGPLYRLLPYPVDYAPYTGAHVVAQLQLLLFSGLAFFVMLGWLRRTLTITLDLDWFYRRLFPEIARGIEHLIGVARTAVSSTIAAKAGRARSWVHRLFGPRGVLARTWPSGSMALWMMVMLLALLASEYLL